MIKKEINENNNNYHTHNHSHIHNSYNDYNCKIYSIIINIRVIKIIIEIKINITEIKTIILLLLSK